VGFSLAGSFVDTTTARVGFSGVAALLSLTALFWPRLRGLSWQQIRQAIGWTPGRGLLGGLGAGVATYVMALPLAAIGLIVTLILMTLTHSLPGAGAPGSSPQSVPEHPIVPIIPGSGLGLKLVILTLAAVIAPIVEETMFRGVFYRHLREATCRL